MAAPTEKSICRLVGERSFQRAKRYFQYGHVHAARRQGNLLKARCYGSYDNDYRLEVELKGSKVVDGWCSCPVGEEGLCKHVAALLLTWRESPDEFRVAQDLESMLANCDRQELIGIIRVLVDANPVLEELLESVLPVGEQNLPETADRARQAVSEALRRAADTGDPELATAAIDEQHAQAERQLSNGQSAAASAIAGAVVTAAVADYDVYSDASGEVAASVGQAAQTLTRCFELLGSDDAQRGDVLRVLLSLLWFDACQVGMRMAESVPETIARHASATEKQTVVQWARDRLSSQTEAVKDDWRRECWGALIADMVGDDLPEDDYLEFCRECGLATEPPQVRPASKKKPRKVAKKGPRKRKKQRNA